MATIRDVASYILTMSGPMPAMKLQKLFFYAHAWSLVWDEKPLTTAHFEAWANGPVCPSLYALHRQKFEVSAEVIGGDANRLTKQEEETIDSVLAYYGKKSALWLSELTHLEKPWKEARKGYLPGEPSNAPITNDAMYAYYGALK